MFVLLSYNAFGGMMKNGEKFVGVKCKSFKLNIIYEKFLNYYLAMFDQDLLAHFHMIIKMVMIFVVRSGNSLYSICIDVNLTR